VALGGETEHGQGGDKSVEMEVGQEGKVSSCWSILALRDAISFNYSRYRTPLTYIHIQTSF